MKKSVFLPFVFLFTAFIFAAPQTAKEISAESAKLSSVNESILYIQNAIPELTQASEKRAAYIFLATIQEQLSLYESAQKNYVAAAAITAADAEGMPKKSNEQLALDAVRCALCRGDWATADSYLNSAVRNSKNAKIQAYIKLYTQWSALCRAETTEDLQEPVEILKAYLNVNSLKEIQSTILLTLWFVTGEGSYSQKLISEYAASTEAAIVRGDVQLLPSPFWFFVPKSGLAEPGSGTLSVPKEEITADESKSESETAPKFSKWQLGLFRTQSNAELLCNELKEKGFLAYITTETRASGTTYYIVLVNENEKGTVSDSLRTAGYDCYPID